ncbi:hypothetical protein SKAU_G00071060 [Synaphobranchus kaupii]|uniref:Uncharacterized protein n=1 Tax=Synaphobranchus kaupii TaxID=118154 RepID=A0A9Q1G780_SYNKA|nr:hypothetical protein SKAU_G00071060 [Synaphobranchus kaupii]
MQWECRARGGTTGVYCISARAAVLPSACEEHGWAQRCPSDPVWRPAGSLCSSPTIPSSSCQVNRCLRRLRDLKDAKRLAKWRTEKDAELKSGMQLTDAGSQTTYWAWNGAKFKNMRCPIQNIIQPIPRLPIRRLH